MSKDDGLMDKVLGGAAAGVIGATSTTFSPTGLAVAGLLGAGGGVAQHFIGMAVSNLKSPDDRRLFEAQEKLAAAALAGAEEQIREKYEGLQDAVGEAEAAASAVPIFQAWSDAWFGSEGKKQRVIMAALVSGFDRESYEAAMTQRFFKLLKELDYPEIHRLCEDVREARKYRKGDDTQFSYSDTDYFFAGRDTTLRRSLSALGLLHLSEQSWSITWLGFELVAFLERGGFSTEPTATGTAPKRA
jgi:hypothetical protein